MTTRKAGRLIGTGIIGVIAVGMALWIALGQPGIGLGNPSGSGYRDSDLDSNLPGTTQCQGTCPGGYFDDNKELFLGTNPLDPCADNTTRNDEADDKWPPDFDDNRAVNMQDIILGFTERIDACQGDPMYVQRSDLNGDTCINQSDVDIAMPYVGKICQESFPDPDNDGFPTIYETKMGTDPNDNCGPNAWPPDIYYNNAVTMQDILQYSGKIDQCWPSSLFDARLDMNGDGCLDLTDVNIVGKYVGQQCTP